MTAKLNAAFIVLKTFPQTGKGVYIWRHAFVSSSTSYQNLAIPLAEDLDGSFQSSGQKQNYSWFFKVGKIRVQLGKE